MVQYAANSLRRSHGVWFESRCRYNYLGRGRPSCLSAESLIGDEVLAMHDWRSFVLLMAGTMVLHRRCYDNGLPSGTAQTVKDGPGARSATESDFEVKPMSQTTMEAAGKSMAKKKQVVINMAKWEAANAYAKQRKIRFRVVSEEQLFHNGKRK